MKTDTEQLGAEYNLYKDFVRSAKKLDEDRWIYGVYGALDGLSTSFSMLRYFFDLYYCSIGATSSSSDALHDWSGTPLGLTTLIAGSLFLMTCGVVGNLAEDNGYEIHFMTLDEAKTEHHVNCFIWDGKVLIYIAPDGQETVFDNEHNTIDSRKIRKLEKKAAAKNTRTVFLSETEADDLLLQFQPFTRAKPSTTPAGSFNSYWPSAIGNINSYWTNARHRMRGMKNNFRTIRNIFFLLDLLAPGHPYRYLMAPSGLLLGVAGAYVRVSLQQHRALRKKASALNKELLRNLIDEFQEILSKRLPTTLEETDAIYEVLLKKHARYLARTKNSPDANYAWLFAYIKTVLTAIFDSPYLYFGVFGLVTAPVASPYFIFVALTTAIFTTLCIASRLYEEFNLQREYQASQLELKLGMALQSLQMLLHKKGLMDEANNLSDTEREQLNRELLLQWEHCKILREAHLKCSTYSIGLFIMSGLKNGLDTYGAFASLMFFLATLSQMLIIPYSQILVISFISAGLLAVLGWTIKALVEYYAINNAHTSKSDTTKLYEQFEAEISPNTRANPIPNTKPPVHIESAAEIPRGTCSGLSKGLKEGSHWLFYFQTMGPDHHYHDSTEMLFVDSIMAALFGLVFGLRGLAKWGKGEKLAKTTTPKPSAESGNSRKDQDNQLTRRNSMNNIEKVTGHTQLTIFQSKHAEPKSSIKRVDSNIRSTEIGDQDSASIDYWTAIAEPKTPSPSTSSSPIGPDFDEECLAEATSPTTVSTSLSNNALDSAGTKEVMNMGMFGKNQGREERRNTLDHTYIERQNSGTSLGLSLTDD